jgi:ribonuclease J
MASRGIEQELVFLPMGGIGEIGMNMYLYGLGSGRQRKWLMVDLGVTFPNEKEPGVDVVLPDIRFIEEQRDALAGVLLTHAHEDHFGAVAELWPRLQAPVYGTRFAMALLKGKLEDQGLTDKVPLHEMELGSRFKIGPFDVELIPMSHSIPETNAVAIRAGGGLVLHTSDWKGDQRPLLGRPTDETRLRALGDEGVDVLIGDSTNALLEGMSPSESEVARTLRKLIARAPRRVAVTTFASNVARLRTVAEAAQAADRHVVLAGRAMQRIVDVARDLGYWPENLDTVPEDQFGYLPHEKVVALCTGSQGESRAALARIAEGEHPNIELSRGDIVIFSSRSIPGNEMAVIRVQNNLSENGVEVITKCKEGPIHASGHPRQGELAKLFEWTRPKVLIPMHGESLHLERHAKFAKSKGIAVVDGVRNGHVVRLLPGEPEIVGEAPVGKVYRDGLTLVPAEGGPVRERRRLSFGGMITVSVALTRDGLLAAEPQAVLAGLPRVDELGREFTEIIEKATFGALESIPKTRRKDTEMVGEAIRRSVRSAVLAAWGKKPNCAVLMMVVKG